MKCILLLSALALVATITPHTNASPTAPPKAEQRPPAVTPDFDLGAQMFCTAPEPSAATFQLFTCEDAVAAHRLVIRPEDALEAPKPLLTAVLTRREAASIRKPTWLLYRYRPADPASA